MIQLCRFHLLDGVDDAAWLEADAIAQAVAHRQPGLLRRTTARGDDGWLVLELWASADAADRRAPDPALDCVDPASLVVERYAELDG